MGLKTHEHYVRARVTWQDLPAAVKKSLGSEDAYNRIIVNISLSHQLRYRGNLVRDAYRKGEKKYYEQLVEESRDNHLLFPYHLADVIVKGLRITPFNYYVSMVESLIRTDKSYDTLPNFTAADCLRLLGISRNEYIDLMHRSKSNRGFFASHRVNIRQLLPPVPCEVHIEPWWRADIGLILDDDMKFVDSIEKALIDYIIDFGSQTVGNFDYQTVSSLYRKGLIYLDIPITGEDRVQVPPLKGFIMNRTLGDYFEKVLYNVFVSIDEHILVSELASVLQVDLDVVKQAVSLFCRLGFAKKIHFYPEWEIIKRKFHPSWDVEHPNRIHRIEAITPLTFDASLTMNNNRSSSLSSSISNLTLAEIHDSFDSPSSASTPTHESVDDWKTRSLTRGGQRIAFLFDSTLTAYLMMGNLTPGLKNHAVTMFEVGKLCDESLDALMSELDKVSALDAEGEGEAQRYFDHAVILRATILALRSLMPSGLDLVRCESLMSLDLATRMRLLSKKYKLLVSMAPLVSEAQPIASVIPPHLGPPVPEMNCIWFKLFLYHVTGFGPPSLLLKKGTEINLLPRLFHGFSYLLVTPWRHEPAIIPSQNITHVNASLRYSSVLIQAYGAVVQAKTKLVPFPSEEKTHQRIVDNRTEPSWKDHPAINRFKNLFNFDDSCGYFTMVNIGVLDVGCDDRSDMLHIDLNEKKHPKRDSSAEILQKPKPQMHSDTFSTNDASDSSRSSNCTTSSGQSGQLISLSESTNDSSFSLFDDDEVKEMENSKAKCNDKALMSPSDESITMFSILDNFVAVECVASDLKKTRKKGEEWTMLSCNFGLPLFDVDANTKICGAIFKKEILEEERLNSLMKLNETLASAIHEFIAKCQGHSLEKFRAGLKRNRNAMLRPNSNLEFFDGRVNVWSGK